MSVFRKLKGSFQNAQQDLVDGLRALTSFDGTSKSRQLHHMKSKDISLDAGADLLHDYQEVWSQIQHETKLCSKKAEEVDIALAPMFTIWDKRTEVVTNLEEEVKSVPNILLTLKDLHTLLETLRQDFSVVESSLSVLENMCEELDLRKAMEEETRKLNNYKSAKEKELERIKVNLARNHARKMQEVESSRSMKMKERVEAFSSAFEEDLDYYKTHGRPDCKLVTDFPKVTSLSEIEIMDDKNDLDNFLGPQTEAEQDPGEEEQYFEDDYTTDFSVKEDLEDLDGEVDLKTQSLLSFNQDYYVQENEGIQDEHGEDPDTESAANENAHDKTQDSAQGENSNQGGEAVQENPAS